MSMTVLAVADLALLVLAAALGVTSLVAWAHHRAAGFPTVKIAMHVTLQVIGIGIWLAFVVTGLIVIGWIAFTVITAGQVFGDMLMFASHRARNRGAAKPSYLSAAGEVLSFKRPVPAFHAVVGALAWFGLLAICLATTLAA